MHEVDYEMKRGEERGGEGQKERKAGTHLSLDALPEGQGKGEGEGNDDEGQGKGEGEGK